MENPDKTPIIQTQAEQPELVVTSATATLATAAAAATSATAATPANPLPPQEIPGYHDVEPLAEGATGLVFKAKTDEDNSDVAIKIYKKELIADQDSAKRFEREVEALSHIKHPNIVKIVSSGKTASGQAFIVMELIDGISIRTILETEGVFEPQRAVKVMREICRALEALHDKNIVHRDLKPNNIILDSNNIAKVVDFGIAKMLNATGDTITQYGSILGTPAYMSPEQCLGEKVDDRSDVYSVGCTLFEMLTGLKAFESQTAMEALAKQIDDDRSHLEKPLAASGAPADLRAIVLKCLQRQPDHRYKNVAELSHDLGASQLNQPLTFAHNKTSSTKTINFDQLDKLHPYWQVWACCGAFVVTAIIIGLNLESIKNGHSSSGVNPREMVPFIIYNRKTLQPLYSDPNAFYPKDAVKSALRNHHSLEYADLSGKELSNCQLAGANLANADLSGTNFGYCNLENADLHGATLQNATFNHASLRKADLSATILPGASFLSASAPEANFMGADLSHANLSDGNFRGANFRNAQMYSTQFKGAILNGADMSYADCKYTHFTGLLSPLNEIKFEGTKNLEFKG